MLHDTTSNRNMCDEYESPSLVDITETDLMGWSTKGYIDSNTHTISNLNNTSHVHKIVWFNRPFWLPMNGIKKHAKICHYNNCEHTDDKKALRNSSAIIYCITEGGLSQNPPLRPSERPANQVWIYFGLESPATQEQYIRGLIPPWKNSLNWSMSYRLDSDIAMPYGYLKTRQIVRKRNFTDIFRRKTKWAAWLVSKCTTPSMRDRFVEKLRKYGLPVDIYGYCGKPLKTNLTELLNNQYKFYLSFENSMCVDYITEKFFKYFNYDTILVVRGGADYKKLLPRNTFIDTAEFKSFKHLVDYIKDVGNNQTLYTTYLQHKDRYTPIDLLDDNNFTYCALCAKLNNKDIYRKSYQHIPRNLDNCYTPGDIDRLDHP